MTLMLLFKQLPPLARSLILAVAMLTIVAVLAPVAGLLTDVKFSRYRAVLCNSYIILVKLFTVIVLAVIIFPVYQYGKSWDFIPLRNMLSVGMIIVSAVYVVFLINAIHFGMDQLHDSDSEHSILFIHWYVWIYYTCSLVAEIIWNLLSYDSLNNQHLSEIRIAGVTAIVLTVFTIFGLKLVSLLALHYRKVWFSVEPAGVNPYKLAYQVTKFAYQHKVPIRRSAFTYNDEETPSRMDTAKQKFGGPFTTKEVEDVKAFWGILKVLMSLGPAFLVQTTTHSLLPMFAKHGRLPLFNYTIGGDRFHVEGMVKYMVIINGLLSHFLVVVCIPAYLCWIRPRAIRHIPGMMRRIEMSLLLMLVSLLSIFVMDAVIHLQDTADDVRCMFYGFNKVNEINEQSSDIPQLALCQNTYFLILQHCLSALANMLMDIAILEFICSQSPYSMKGLLLGFYFSTRSLFQGIAVTLIFPFALWKIQSLSCGSGFYAMMVIIALLEFVLFVFVAKRYKYRNVNEPSYEYRYAENYYSNIQSSQ
jgi:peptide/histidine transporter 3/4